MFSIAFFNVDFRCIAAAIQSGVAGHVRRLLESNPNQFDARTLVYLQILLQ
jgi:hypothetical protein